MFVVNKSILCIDVVASSHLLKLWLKIGQALDISSVG